MNLPDKKALALHTLQHMQQYAAAGTSRTTDPAQIGRFCDLFDLPHDSAFCAAGLFYCMCKAFCELVGLDVSLPELRGAKPILAAHYLTPTPSCGEILHDAKIRGIWIPKADIHPDDVKPGWLTLWCWDGSGHPQHVGMVETATHDILHDLEANTSSASDTNGGACARRERQYGPLLGYVSTYR